MIRKFILFLLITSFLGCKNSKAPKDFFIPLFQENSTNFKSNFSSGIYSKDSIILEFSCEDKSLLKLICGNDTVISKEYIQYKLRNLKPKLMYIPTASKKYSSYTNSWFEPKGSFSSLQKIKLYQIQENLILDSMVFNYILGAHSESEIPIVNLTIDPEDLFSPDSGCYVPGNSFIKKKDQITGNFYKYKRRKQKSHIEIINKENTFLSGNYDFRIHGYITPLAPQKSLRFYLKEKNLLNQLLEVNHNVDKIILRSSYSGWGNEIFTDGFIANICKNLNVDIMSYHPVITYINGEYWGIHGLRERMDLKAISNKYQIKKKKIIDADDKGYSKKKGYGKLNVLLKLLKENPNVSYQKVAKKFKMKSLIDWLIVELFFQNTDWPCNNTFFWKKKKKKWNCVLIDMDACIGSAKFNMFNFVLKDRSPALGGVLISYLLKQKEFITLFISRANFLMENDLSPKNLELQFLDMKKQFSPIVKEHYRRWNNKNGFINYNKALLRIELFCKNRSFHFKKNMNDFFNSSLLQ